MCLRRVAYPDDRPQLPTITCALTAAAAGVPAVNDRFAVGDYVERVLHEMQARISDMQLGHIYHRC